MPDVHLAVLQELSESEIEQNRSISKEMQGVFLELFSPDRCDAIREDFESLDRERANWLRAIRLSKWENASRLATGLFEYLQARGLWQEIEDIWTDLIQNSPNDRAYDRHRVGMLHHQLGIIFLDQRKTKEAQRCLSRCLELAAAAQWTQLEANTLFQLAVSHRHLGQYRRSKQLLVQALQVAQKTDDRRLDQYIQGQLTYVLVAEGKLNEAASLLEESLVQWQKFERPSDRMLAHTTLHILGRIYLQQGLYPEAEKALEESLRLKLLLDSGTHLISHTRCLLAEVYVALERYSEAESCLVESIQSCTAMGDSEYVAIARKTLGYLRYRQRRYKDSEAILALAAVDAERSGNPQVRLDVAIWHMRASIRSGRLRGICNDILIAAQATVEAKFSLVTIISMFPRLLRKA